MFGSFFFRRVYLNGGFSNYSTKRWNQKLVGNTNKLGEPTEQTKSAIGNEDFVTNSAVWKFQLKIN